MGSFKEAVVDYLSSHALEVAGRVNPVWFAGEEAVGVGFPLIDKRFVYAVDGVWIYCFVCDLELHATLLGVAEVAGVRCV